MRLSLVRALIAVGVIAAALGVWTQTGSAISQGDLSVSKAHPSVSKDYPPIPGSNPSLTHRPSDCQTAPYCDVINLHVDASAFPADEAYQVSFSLSWLNVENNSDDLEIHVYDKNGTKVASNTVGNSPAKTSVDHPYTGLYYIVINNFAGATNGYTVMVDLEDLGKLKAIPKLYEPTGPRFTPLPPLPNEGTGKVGPQTPPPQSLAPGSTLAPVLTPGPDGKLQAYGLNAVPAGKQTKTSGPTWWVILILVVALVAVLGGGGFFFARRLRARAA